MKSVCVSFFFFFLPWGFTIRGPRNGRKEGPKAPYPRLSTTDAALLPEPQIRPAPSSPSFPCAVNPLRQGSLTPPVVPSFIVCQPPTFCIAVLECSPAFSTGPLLGPISLLLLVCSSSRCRSSRDLTVLVAMAAVGMTMSLKSSTALKGDFLGAALKQTVAAPKAANVAFAVRAAGYDEELVKTAVTALPCWLLEWVFGTACWHASIGNRMSCGDCG